MCACARVLFVKFSLISVDHLEFRFEPLSSSPDCRSRHLYRCKLVELIVVFVVKKC